MNLTFKGFLAAYCRELSEVNTLSMRTLCSHAATTHPRVAEPLFIFAAETNKLDYLLALARNTWMQPIYEAEALKLQTAKSLHDYLKQEGESSRFGRVLVAYEAHFSKVAEDRRVIALMRDHITNGLKGRGLTTYRMCKDLSLNMGNAYAYLGKGDVTKVSRATARRMLEYATSQ